MSFETRKQDAAAILRKWEKANASPIGQTRLINDKERLWRMARDLAFALDNLYAHTHGHGVQCRTAESIHRADQISQPTKET